MVRFKQSCINQKGCALFDMRQRLRIRLSLTLLTWLLNCLADVDYVLVDRTEELCVFLEHSRTP